MRRRSHKPGMAYVMWELVEPPFDCPEWSSLKIRPRPSQNGGSLSVWEHAGIVASVVNAKFNGLVAAKDVTTPWILSFRPWEQSYHHSENKTSWLLSREQWLRGFRLNLFSYLPHLTKKKTNLFRNCPLELGLDLHQPRRQPNPRSCSVPLFFFFKQCSIFGSKNLWKGSTQKVLCRDVHWCSSQLAYGLT